MIIYKHSSSTITDDIVHFYGVKGDMSVVVIEYILFLYLTMPITQFDFILVH